MNARSAAHTLRATPQRNAQTSRRTNETRIFNVGAFLRLKTITLYFLTFTPLDALEPSLDSSCGVELASAPRIVNSVDVNGKGIVYRFDIRDYRGYTLIDTSAPDWDLFNTLSDDDIGFSNGKVDRNGNPPRLVFENFIVQQNKLKPEVTRDDKFARVAWARVLRGTWKLRLRNLSRRASPLIDLLVRRGSSTAIRVLETRLSFRGFTQLVTPSSNRPGLRATPAWSWLATPPRRIGEQYSRTSPGPLRSYRIAGC